MQKDEIYCLWLFLPQEEKEKTHLRHGEFKPSLLTYQASTLSILTWPAGQFCSESERSFYYAMAS